MEEHEVKPLLKQLYETENLSLTTIAVRTDQSSATIRRWLHDLGVQVRPAGGAQNSARISWRLHHLHPRYVQLADTREIASVAACSINAVYKYKRRLTGWTSA
jgi:transposase